MDSPMKCRTFHFGIIGRKVRQVSQKAHPLSFLLPTLVIYKNEQISDTLPLSKLCCNNYATAVAAAAAVTAAAAEAEAAKAVAKAAKAVAAHLTNASRSNGKKFMQPLGSIKLAICSQQNFFRWCSGDQRQRLSM